MGVDEEFNKRRKKFLQTGLAIVCILGGITGSLLLVLAGLFMIPAISDKLQNKLKYSDKVKWGIFVVLFILAIFTTDAHAPLNQNSLINQKLNTNVTNTLSNEDIKNEVGY